MENQKIGGIAGILEAILYIFGIAFLFFFLSPAMAEANSELEKLNFVLEHKTLFQIWHLLIYVIFGLLLIPLTIVINEQFRANELISTKVTPVLGFLWSGMVISSGMINNVGMEMVQELFVEDQAAALTAWETIGAIQNGLGGGVEIVGGLWVLLISWYGLKFAVFPKPLNYLGLIVGATGTLTIIPGLKDLGLIFGLTQIFWFAWIGIVLFRTKKPAEQVA